jgi:hypothetical protein
MDDTLAADITAELEDAGLREADLVAFCDHSVEGLLEMQGPAQARQTVRACIAHADAAELKALKTKANGG